MFAEQLHGDWVREGARLFGEDKNQWRFLCPKCGRVASPMDFEAISVPGGTAVVECIGRYREPRCDGGSYFYSTMPKDREGRTVLMPDGSRAQVLDFAPKTMFTKGRRPLK